MYLKLQTRIVEFIFHTQYRKEIITVISIKLLVIILLWQMFFSHPIDHKLTKNDLTQHYISAESSN